MAKVGRRLPVHESRSEEETRSPTADSSDRDPEAPGRATSHCADFLLLGTDEAGPVFDVDDPAGVFAAAARVVAAAGDAEGLPAFYD